ncbi:MAG: Ca-activated chloride channel [Acidobacteriota bacterium]|jgi:Ca-activated chloride channel family protein|nr:Ca-activated chloride channel [Acidobacteriota bacterium]
MIRRASVFAALALLSLASLHLSPASRAAQQQQDARPRRATSAATPTPTPARTTATQTTTRPAPTQTPNATQTQAQAPSAAPSTSPTPPALKGQDIEPDEVLTVDTNLVNLHVRVIDRNNRPINDVAKEEFRVFEDNVPQKVEFFSREEVPISYGMVVDNSGSMKPLLEKVIEATRILIDQNKPGDETFLMRFVDSDEIRMLQDFTASKDDLYDALDNMHTDGGQTAIIDAVYLAAEHTAGYKKGDALNDKRRRAMILVTDGEDRSSYYKMTQLFEYLRENDVQIYVIGFTSELDAEGGFIRKSQKDKATELINKLATETGGRAFFPTSLAELPTVAQEITKDMRTQYVIGYYPTNTARDGTVRQIKVQIADAGKRDHRIAITRTGRVAGAGGAKPAPSNTSRSESPRRP